MELFDAIRLLFYLVLLIMMVLSFLKLKKRYEKGARQQEKLLHEQALKRNGRVERGGWTAEFEIGKDPLYPKLFFNYCGYDITVFSRPGSRNSPPSTHAEIPLQFSQDVKLKLSRDRKISGLRKMLGVRDMQIGNTEFDDTFFIRGNDEPFVRRLLIPEVQEKLLILKDGNPVVQMTQTELSISITLIPKNAEAYDIFIDTVVFLLEHLKSLA